MVDPLDDFLRVSVLPEGPSTFFALAVVGFMKLIPLLLVVADVVRRVLGSVLAPRMGWGVRADEEDMPPNVPVLARPVRIDPLRDMLLVTELRDALELDLLRFSLELVAGRPLFMLATGFAGPLRLLTELAVRMEVLDSRVEVGVVLSLDNVDRRTVRGDSRPTVILARDLVEECMLG